MDIDLAAIDDPMLQTVRVDSLVRCCIIFYHVVEFHPADRCLRQFGMHQHIPDPPLAWSVVDRQGVGARDWAAYHVVPIQDWAERFQRFAVHGDIAVDLHGKSSVFEFLLKLNLIKMLNK